MAFQPLLFVAVAYPTPGTTYDGWSTDCEENLEAVMLTLVGGAQGLNASTACLDTLRFALRRRSPHVQDGAVRTKYLVISQLVDASINPLLWEL